MRNSMMGMQNTGCRISPDSNNRGMMQMGYHLGNPQAAMQSMQHNNQHGISQDTPMNDMQHGRGACIPQETSIDCVMLATAYVPFQKFCGTWPPLKSLIAGTIFPELFSPYKKREYVNLEPEVTCGNHPAGGRLQ